MTTPSLSVDAVESVYIHIPFCAHLCHYCDFVKTARYDVALVERYFLQLKRELHERLQQKRDFETIFLGGGTPGLFSSEYEAILGGLSAKEITIEANPRDLTPDKLKSWRRMGINRLSIGVQSFDELALKLLSRDHSSVEARSGIASAMSEFSNVNIDLIYGWPKQTLGQWRSDLQTAISMKIPHLSLYCLTYEYGTTLARRMRRGVVAEKSDDFLADCYQLARDLLGAAGYVHEEVSNWCLPSYSCKHNYTYWQDASYLGIGAGAHGYVREVSSIGHRYRNTEDLRVYAESGANSVVEQRSVEDWLTEYVGCSLRCAKGADLKRIETISGKTLHSSKTLDQAFADGTLKLSDDGRLRLDSSAWFLETAWALEVLSCLDS